MREWPAGVFSWLYLTLSPSKKNCSSSASQAATCWLFIVLFMSSISASAKAMTLHSFNCMKVSAMSATLHHVCERNICSRGFSPVPRHQCETAGACSENSPLAASDWYMRHHSRASTRRFFCSVADAPKFCHSSQATWDSGTLVGR